jgi:hypothetical protein
VRAAAWGDTIELDGTRYTLCPTSNKNLALKKV